MDATFLHILDQCTHNLSKFVSTLLHVKMICCMMVGKTDLGWDSEPEADQKYTGSRLKENLKPTESGLLFIVGLVY